jgi:uncharacterized caspase-like protein
LGDHTRALIDYEAALAISSSYFKAVSARNRVRVAMSPPPTSPGESLTGGASDPGERVALVIGNGNYDGVGQLQNPLRDAAAVAKAFERLGFRAVLLESDLSRDAMIKALRRFETEAETADWAVIYYAGHGIEVGGVNYLVPVDARLKTDRDVQDEAVSLERVLSAVEGTRKFRLVILDACRDNPFSSRMRRTLASRSIGRGLAPVDPPAGGILIAYAAKHGQVAFDGEGEHSPFVRALLDRLDQPGVEVRRLFGFVRDDVLTATEKKQEPFLYGSVGGEEYFFRPR